MSVLELTRPLSVHSPLCLFIQFDTHFIPLTAYLLLVTPPPPKKKKIGFRLHRVNLYVTAVAVIVHLGF